MFSVNQKREIADAGPAHVSTWNVCPDCGHSWTEKVPIPGVPTQSIRCLACRKKTETGA